MDKKIKQKWIKALLSKKYRQGQRALCVSDKRTKTCKYCCLGVLYDLVGEEWIVKPSPFPSDSLIVWAPYYDNLSMSHKLLGAEVLNQVGLSYQHQLELANMNDRGISFKKIAEYIEKEL